MRVYIKPELLIRLFEVEDLMQASSPGGTGGNEGGGEPDWDSALPYEEDYEEPLYYIF